MIFSLNFVQLRDFPPNKLKGRKDIGVKEAGGLPREELPDDGRDAGSFAGS